MNRIPPLKNMLHFSGLKRQGKAEGETRIMINGLVLLAAFTCAGAYSLPFFISLLIRCMYALYQVAIIWVLPVLPTIEKSRKKGEPSDLTFFGYKRLNLFFSPFLVPLPVYEFL